MENLLMFHNIKIITKGYVFSLLTMPFRTGQFHRKFVYWLKTFSVESLNFFVQLHVSLSYIYLKYLVSGYLKDLSYSNAEYED